MIDTKAIRKKILDLALRGKLTEQLPEDGTAEELYQQIQQEKAAMIKAGIIKSGKPLPHVTINDTPCIIPENWKWVRWGNLSEQIQYGYIASAQNTGRIKMVRISDIQGNKVIWENVPYCDIDEETIEIYKLHQNDILFARTGGTVGKSYLVENVDTEAVFAGYLIRTSYSKSLSARYIKYFMDSDLYWKQLQDGTIATAQPNCNGQTLSKMILPLPPAAEQIRIVERIRSIFSILDTIDTLQNQYQDNLGTLKSKIIDAGIQGKLTEQLPEDGTAAELYQQIHTNQGIEKKDIADINADLPEIPFTWCWVHLGDIVRVLGGKRIPAGRKLTTEDTGHKYIRISDMKNRSVDAEKLLFVPEDIYPSITQYIIHKEDVYITVAGTIGRVGKIPESVDGANLTENADRLVFSNLDQDWLIYCLTSTFVQKQIEYLTTQVAQPKLAIKRIQEFLLPLPPFAEQKRIVAKLEELLQFCED